jgi:transcriptional regulator with XRE-family HTH domain
MGTIERGESNLSFSNLVKVANALGITLSKLLSGVERRATQFQEHPLVGAAGARQRR